MSKVKSVSEATIIAICEAVIARDLQLDNGEVSFRHGTQGTPLRLLASTPFQDGSDNPLPMAVATLDSLGIYSPLVSYTGKDGDTRCMPTIDAIRQMAPENMEAKILTERERGLAWAEKHHVRTTGAEAPTRAKVTFNSNAFLA